ncbi:DUF3987 domain-containing protein [Nocardiopsis ansamitocini]|uniref:DNA helicase DnaB-like N-terminal domain-containing protein n=1 Tax=Nocardiopsis ansamitocini TaxID=1670832 RepID=A0A9W6PAA2_9ACTN|nr:DUF3987 domain-containing protein [Nocardiopsis ansamitocini]GLU49851.1 hypothetical protein Nans01_42020 [Nocardiopsis ansamitocini]
MALMAVPEPAEGPDWGPMPPHDLGAEQAALGAMLLSPEAIADVARLVVATDFYRPAHQILFATITRLHRQGEPADPVSVNAALTQSGEITRVGGAPYLHTLTESVPVAANGGYYARTVADLAQRRAVVETGTRLVQVGYSGDGDIGDLMQVAKGHLDTVRAKAAWTDPVALDAVQGTLPEFPLEALPEWVGRFAAAVSDSTQTPPDLAGCLALAALSTAASGRVWADTGQWSEPVCVYTVAAMEPASRKSAVFAAMNEPVFAAEEHLVEHMKPVIIEAALTKRIADAKAEELAAKAEKDRDPQSIADAMGAAESAGELSVPHQPKLVADDITPENLARRLAEQGGRLSLLAPEGGFFGTLAGRYSGMPNLDTFLKAHAGEPIRVDRQGREPDFVAKSALTIGIALQPEALSEVFATPGGRGRGLLARILYALPADNVGYRTATSVPVPPDVAQTYRHRLTTLLYSLWNLTEPVTLTFTPEARQRITRLLYEEVEPQLRPEGRLGQIRDWGGKYVGAIVRIAALIHLGDHLTDGWARPIDTATLEKAYAIGEYYAEHALAVFGAMGNDPAHEIARKVLDWLTKTTPGEFSARDAFRALRTKQVAKAGDLEAPLALLADLGWIRPAPVPPTGKKGGRPPSPKYLVHPDISGPRA